MTEKHTLNKSFPKMTLLINKFDFFNLIMAKPSKIEWPHKKRICNLHHKGRQNPSKNCIVGTYSKDG